MRRSINEGIAHLERRKRQTVFSQALSPARYSTEDLQLLLNLPELKGKCRPQVAFMRHVTESLLFSICFRSLGYSPSLPNRPVCGRSTVCDRMWRKSALWAARSAAFASFCLSKEAVPRKAPAKEGSPIGLRRHRRWGSSFYINKSKLCLYDFIHRLPTPVAPRSKRIRAPQLRAQKAEQYHLPTGTQQTLLRRRGVPDDERVLPTIDYSPASPLQPHPGVSAGRHPGSILFDTSTKCIRHQKPRSSPRCLPWPAD